VFWVHLQCTRDVRWILGKGIGSRERGYFSTWKLIIGQLNSVTIQ